MRNSPATPSSTKQAAPIAAGQPAPGQAHQVARTAKPAKPAGPTAHTSQSQQGLLEEAWHAAVDFGAKAAGVAFAALVVAIIVAIYQGVRRKKAKQPDYHGEPAAGTITVQSPEHAQFRLEAIKLRYAELVLLSNSTLAFGDVTRGSVDASANVGTVRLEEVWTPLEGWRGGGADALLVDRPIIEQPPVDVAEFALANQKTIILGDPGSGKSTTMAHIAADLAKALIAAGTTGAEHRPIPIRARLAQYVPSPAPSVSDLWTAVPEIEALGSAHGFSHSELEAFKGLLTNALREGRAVLLLDGVDEIAEAKLAAFRQFFHLLEASLGSSSRIVATCRSYDYRLAVPNRRLPIDDILTLVPFTPSKQEHYVTQWYDAVVRIGRLDAVLAQSRRERLISSLMESETLAQLARTPLLLTLLTLIHTEEGELPQARSLVYQRAIRYMLAETAQWRQSTPGATVASSEMMAIACRVGFYAHTKEETEGTDYRGLLRDELLVIVQSHFGLNTLPAGSALNDALEKSRIHLSRLIQSNGLLLDRGGGFYSFAHRAFQEFLAGQHFASGGHHIQAVEVARSDHWREPFLLMAGYGAKEGGNVFYVLTLAGEFLRRNRAHPFRPVAPADCILAAEMLLEIGLPTLKTLGFDIVFSSEASSGDIPGLWQRAAAQASERVEDPELPLVVRLRAANVAGRVGDRRLVQPDGDPISPLYNLVRLPAGTATIGSKSERSKPDERPIRRIKFSEFGIGKYLITNHEYEIFVDAGGYEENRYWSSEYAKRWLVGDEVFIKEITTAWLETVWEHHSKEIRDGEINGGQLEKEAARLCASRRLPLYWKDRRFGRSNQPVVGINWWEARAYAAWLTENHRERELLGPAERFRLPTEFEWERAARWGASTEYPWGNEWENDRGHVGDDDLNLREATPVGCYPAGTWMNGPLDMFGNVWEWLETLKLPYDAKYDERRLEIDSFAERSIRGSSWYNTSELARTTARFVDRSFNLFFDVGFRLVLEGERETYGEISRVRD